jgi:hypothetical protein
MSSLLKTTALLTILGGCVASAGVGYQATVVTPPPAVVVEPAPPPPPPPEPVVEVEYVEPAAYVYIGPNVQVIEDYDYPVFYSDSLYWRFEGGVWYSSSWHDRGWVSASTVPVYVRQINRPEQFVHYRANPQARAGQPGFRAVVTAPIHHPGPPPRYVEQPGHPVHAVQAAQPVGAQPQPLHPEPMHPEHPEHPMGPPGHAEGVPPGHMEPPPGQGHQPPPPVEHEPPGHAQGVHENPMPPPGAAAHAPPPAAAHAPPPPPPAAHAPPPAPAKHPADKRR